MANEISVQYGKALELHKKIQIYAQLVQTNLWDMCTGLKEMSDGKLYKELGYQNFEEYCSTEFGFSRQQAHKYISIIENVKRENVNSSLHFGVSKLYLLSTLSEADQKKITAENDVEDMTVKELEAEIRDLKQKNHEMDVALDEQGDLLVEMRIKTADAKRDKEEALQEVDRLTKRIGELESRPIEATVSEQSEDVRQLRETIKNLERVSEEQVDQLQEEHLRDIRKLHEQNRVEIEKQLADQKAEYEKKLAEAEKNRQADSVDDKQVFKAYYAVAYDAFKRMMEFAGDSEKKEFFKVKIGNMLHSFINWNTNL